VPAGIRRLIDLARTQQGPVHRANRQARKVTVRPAASRIDVAAISTRDSAMALAGHAHTKASGPGGGSGHTQCSMSQVELPPAPALLYQHRSIRLVFTVVSVRGHAEDVGATLAA
jgi:hypothetical protein